MSIRIAAVFLALIMAIGNVKADTLPLRVFMQPEDYDAPATQYGNNLDAGHYAAAPDDGAKLYYEVYGEGQPVLVMHGGGVGCPYEMGQLVDSLRALNKYQVILMTTRGHGRSEIGANKVNYTQRGTDAHAVLSPVTKQPAVVIGFSDGAYASYKLASMYPESVKKLVAIGAGENLDQLRKIVPSTVDAMKKVDPQFMDAWMSVMPEPQRLQEYWRDFYEMYNTTIMSKELFMSIKCPVLVMAGELDPNAPLATVIAAYQQIPQSQLAIIAGAPHPVLIANFNACWTNIRPFME